MHAAPSLGDEFPDFTAQTHKGEIKWHDFIADSWALLFAHPEDFLPVSTTELGSVQSLQKAFEQTTQALVDARDAQEKAKTTDEAGKEQERDEIPGLKTALSTMDSRYLLLPRLLRAGLVVRALRLGREELVRRGLRLSDVLLGRLLLAVVPRAAPLAELAVAHVLLAVDVGLAQELDAQVEPACFGHRESVLLAVVGELQVRSRLYRGQRAFTRAGDEQARAFRKRTLMRSRNVPG